jgi:predicted Zn-dependent protease
MTTSYPATYYAPDGKNHLAEVFVSPVTITVRYTEPGGTAHELYWLEKHLTAFIEKPGGTELNYKDLQGQQHVLLITDAALLQAIKKQLGHNRVIGKLHQRVMGNLWTKLLLVAGILLALLLAAYLWLVPLLGERIAINFSKEYEISMGEKMYRAMESGFQTDVRKTALLNQFYQQLQYKVDYPITITVVESDQLNAFAIPGGHIVVYSAILEKMKTPEELAALLGHEASHIAGRHSLRNMFRSLARKMFLSLVIGSEAGIVSVVVDHADDLKRLAYSRALETEADNSGLQLMAQSGVNPQGMVRLMELLQQESGNAGSSNFLRTHPVFKDRIANIKKQLEALPQQSAPQPDLQKIFAELKGDW